MISYDRKVLCIKRGKNHFEGLDPDLPQIHILNDAFVNTNDIQFSSRNFGCRLKSKLKWINLKERCKCRVILLQCSIYIVEKEKNMHFSGIYDYTWMDIHIFVDQ